MRFLFCWLLFSSLGNPCFAQKTGEGYDSASEYKRVFDNESDLKITHLSGSTDSFHFRFSRESQIVDIWSDTGGGYKGVIINYVRSYVSPKSKKKEKIFQEKENIEKRCILEILKLIATISEIRTQKQIPGWEMGRDGTTYIFETASLSSYAFKSYWSPDAQDSSLAEAMIIQHFIDDINTLLQLTRSFEKFYDKLKPGRYVVREGWYNIKYAKEKLIK